MQVARQSDVIDSLEKLRLEMLAKVHELRSGERMVSVVRFDLKLNFGESARMAPCTHDSGLRNARLSMRERSVCLANGKMNSKFNCFY